jgi:hypothetical protein
MADPRPSGARYRRRYNNAEESEFPVIHKVGDWLEDFINRHAKYLSTASVQELYAIADSVAEVEDESFDRLMRLGEY